MLEYFIWTPVSKLRWKLHLNWYISLQENAFENVRKMTAILSRPRYFKVKLVVQIFCCVRIVAPDILSRVLKMELKSNQMYQILIYSGNDTGKMQLAIRTSIHWYFVYLQVRIGFVVIRLGMQGWAKDRKKHFCGQDKTHAILRATFSGAFPVIKIVLYCWILLLRNSFSKSPINNKITLFQIMVGHWKCNKPLSESIMI